MTDQYSKNKKRGLVSHLMDGHITELQFLRRLRANTQKLISMHGPNIIRNKEQDGHAWIYMSFYVRASAGTVSL